MGFVEYERLIKKVTLTFDSGQILVYVNTVTRVINLNTGEPIYGEMGIQNSVELGWPTVDGSNHRG